MVNQDTGVAIIGLVLGILLVAICILPVSVGQFNITTAVFGAGGILLIISSILILSSHDASKRKSYAKVTLALLFLAIVVIIVLLVAGITHF